jgi:CheY-like chemotaxis protein
MEENASPRTTEPLLIFIVDDEISLAETLAEVVRELGYDPEVAYNGEQALALARSRWPALVMTDLMMPLMSGTDLIRALYMEATARNLVFPRIVLMTAIRGSALPDVHVDARLSKPFDLDELERVLQRLCGRASS